jgi:hypothetical protein
MGRGCWSSTATSDQLLWRPIDDSASDDSGLVSAAGACTRSISWAMISWLSGCLRGSEMHTPTDVISKPVYRILSELTQESRLEVALPLAIKDWVRLSLKEA